jgi:hypothetical protein
MPCVLDGVMLGLMTAPKGVCNDKPPANGFPPGVV